MTILPISKYSYFFVLFFYLCSIFLKSFHGAISPSLMVLFATNFLDWSDPPFPENLSFFPPPNCRKSTSKFFASEMPSPFGSFPKIHRKWSSESPLTSKGLLMSILCFQKHTKKKQKTKFTTKKMS